ncbi:hypothetical protein [Faecalispora jeddahensis]|uniref:hypothetical protein n=1 Tax=Faecalispora jeddahensis TaxID=1414721 RepID=UPI00189976E7|nr:hypothetical protein [Faecalispora jeddahensis]
MAHRQRATERTPQQGNGQQKDSAPVFAPQIFPGDEVARHLAGHTLTVDGQRCMLLLVGGGDDELTVHFFEKTDEGSFLQIWS